MMKAFISHSSKDVKLALRVERALTKDGLSAWLDRSEIQYGELLRKQLQDAIRGSKAVVLLWSKAAARSRWVASEIISAFHFDRFIIPCVLDGAQLPMFLQSDVQIDFRKSLGPMLAAIPGAVRKAKRKANEYLSIAGGQRAEVLATVTQIAQAQAIEMTAL